MTKTVRPRKLAPAFQWASDVAHLRNGAHEKSVALALVAHTTDLRIDLPVYPSNETICAFTGLDDSAVRKGLRALEAAGLVRREARPRQPSLIWLTRVGSTPHEDHQPGSVQPPMNGSDGGSVQPPSRGVRSTRVETSSMGGSLNPGSNCDSTRVGSTPQSPDSDHENQNQNPPILSSRSEDRPARESDPATTETRGPESISSTGESENQTPNPPEPEMPTMTGPISQPLSSRDGGTTTEGTEDHEDAADHHRNTTHQAVDPSQEPRPERGWLPRHGGQPGGLHGVGGGAPQSRGDARDVPRGQAGAEGQTQGAASRPVVGTTILRKLSGKAGEFAEPEAPEALITTTSFDLAQRASLLWSFEVAEEIGLRLLHARNTKASGYLAARTTVIQAIGARVEVPPRNLDAVLPPLGAPEFVAGEDAQKATLRGIVRPLAGAPRRPASAFGRVETAPPTGNGAQKPPPLDRRPALERFAAQPEAVKARWLGDVDLASGGMLVGVAREAAAANRWDKAQSQPRPATSAGRLNGAAGRA